LIITTIIIVQQTNHFMSQPTGIESEAVAEFLLPENKPELIQTLKERLLQVPGVQSVSMSNTGSTSENMWGGDFEATVSNNVVKEFTNVKFADEDYIKTYGLKLIQGENIVKSDTATRFVVNETFTKALGFENPADAIGIPVNMWGNKAMISGVIKDFHASPLKVELSPVIILAGTRSYYVGAVKLNTKDLIPAMKSVQSVWESVYPKYVFEYKFLDDQIASFYDGERRNAYTLGFFSLIAICIACIGLFGLVSFMVQQKVKEIGIRKTFGATVFQIVRILSNEFLILIGIAFVLAAPIAFYFMDKWLSNFPYKYTMNGLEFFAAFVLTLLISMITVGYRSVRAARANPVDALRTE
jgi:ABC-type antimicrobial peptide transport system permease subunit